MRPENIMTTIYILSAINLFLNLLILIFVLGGIRAKNLGKVHPDYKILKPEQVLGDDLHWALGQVRASLGTSRKGDSFPSKVSLASLYQGQMTNFSWTNNIDAMKIVGGILEQEGYVVYQDVNCGAHEIMIDVPRSKLKKPE